MNTLKLLSLIILLFFGSLSIGHVCAEQEKIDLYKSSKLALGIGTAIVKFDTNLKFADKTTGNATYLDLEGNLDLPEVSTVITLYGA